MQDPAAALLIFVAVDALGALRDVAPKIEWVAPSMIGQWIYVFFRHGHPQLRTILVSMQCTGPYQRNGASLVFMRCVVLEILFINSLSLTCNK